MKIKVINGVRLIGVGFFKGGKGYDVSDTIGAELISRGHATKAAKPKPAPAKKETAKK